MKLQSLLKTLRENEVRFVIIGGLSLLVLTVDGLIWAKTAAGRPKALLDLAALKKIAAKEKK